MARFNDNDAASLPLSPALIFPCTDLVSGEDKKTTLDDITDAVDLVITGNIGAHEIPIMAGSMGPRSTNGSATLATTAAGSGQPDMVYLAFDAAAIEYAQFAIPMPKSWNEGTIKARFLWAHPAAVTNFGVVWGIQAVAVSNDDTMAVNFGTAVEVTDTGGTTSDYYRSDETAAMTVAGTPADNDLVFFQVYRKATDGADTMTVDAYLLGVVLVLTTSAETDA